MSAHDGGQADETTRDGGPRRLPDPPPAPTRLTKTPAAPPTPAGVPEAEAKAEGGAGGGHRLSDFEPGLMGARSPGGDPADHGPEASRPHTVPPPYSGGPYAPPAPVHPQPAHPPLPQPPGPALAPVQAPVQTPVQSQAQSAVPAQPMPQSAAPPQPQPQAQPYAGGRQPARPPAAPYRPVPTRVPVPVVRPELAGTEGRTRHGDTLARRTGRYLKRLVASSEDSATVMAAAQAIGQRLASGRQIAVTSIRGGSGKSTVAALLALTYAHHRTDPVLAVEADPALGTLPRRLSATEVRWSCADLARILDPSMQITDLIGYLLPFPGGGWLLPGSQGTVGAQLDLDTYRIVMTSMQRYFAATVVDCQTLPAEVARTALTTTQARVLVTPATVEGVAATRTVLEWLGTLHRSMLPTTVVALTHTAPDSTLDVRRSVELLGQGGAHVVTLPYDRHLAGGGAVRRELLARETQEAAVLLAGAVLDRAAPRR